MTMNYEQKYKEALENFKIIKNANKDNKELVYFIECEYPELRESEDERIRKEIIQFLQLPHPQFVGKRNHEEWISWLEKQGEQNPTDKVEPKFKVGDWVVYNRDDYSREIIQVYDIRDGRYYFTNNIHFSWSIKECDEKSHLWTIGDAKDGDVLSDEKPFIFRGFGDREHPHNPTAYCGITSSGTFILSTENEWWTADDFYPATKEQCDLLFQKMREAGYVWYAEKKELKKIEQASTWSEEDEKNVPRNY